MTTYPSSQSLSVVMDQDAFDRKQPLSSPRASPTQPTSPRRDLRIPPRTAHRMARQSSPTSYRDHFTHERAQGGPVCQTSSRHVSHTRVKSICLLPELCTKNSIFPAGHLSTRPPTSPPPTGARLVGRRGTRQMCCAT